MIQGGDGGTRPAAVLSASEMARITAKALTRRQRQGQRACCAAGHRQDVSHVSDDMLAGRPMEIEARALYTATIAAVDEEGRRTSRPFGDGLVISCSPDGLVSDDGLIEIKSRRQVPRQPKRS